MNHPVIKIIDIVVPTVLGLAYFAFLYWGNLATWIAIAATVGFACMFALWIIARTARDKASRRRMFLFLQRDKLKRAATFKTKSRFHQAAACFEHFLEGQFSVSLAIANDLALHSSDPWHQVAVAVRQWIQFENGEQISTSAVVNPWFHIPPRLLTQLVQEDPSEEVLNRLSKEVRFPPLYRAWAHYRVARAKNTRGLPFPEHTQRLQELAPNTYFTQATVASFNSHDAV